MEALSNVHAESDEAIKYYINNNFNGLPISFMGDELMYRLIVRPGRTMSGGVGHTTMLQRKNPRGARCRGISENLVIRFHT